MNQNLEPKFRVEHPKVKNGKCVSMYVKPEPTAGEWRVAAELPIQYGIKNGRFEPKYTDYTEMIDSMFSLLVDFKLEGWRERRSSPLSSVIDLRMFDLVYASSGSSPQKVPFWGPSKIDLEKVFRRNELVLAEQVLPDRHNGANPWMNNTKKDRHYTNIWVGAESPAPFPQGMRADLKELVHIFGYPFYFYEPGKWDKPVGTDPFRMHLMIGVGNYLPGPQLRQVMGIMSDAGIVDPKELQKFAHQHRS